MRKHPRQKRKVRRPDVLKVVGLLYQPAGNQGGTLEVKRSQLQLTKVAAMSNCTRSAVTRIKEAFEEGGLE